jgi:hypothetical protein
MGLLALERMRMIDTIHHWSVGTHQSYSGKMRFTRRFESHFGVEVVPTPQLDKPPSSHSIRTMWVQEFYSLQPARWSRKAMESDPTLSQRVTYNTIRGLRSAVSMAARLNLMVTHPDRVYLDQSHRAVVSSCVGLTDGLDYSFLTTGMKSRIGTESKPSTALLDRHIRYLNREFMTQYDTARSRPLQAEICRAALTNLVDWTAWLRGNELFSLRHCDIDVTLPGDGEVWDLPSAIGVLGLRLLPDTKYNRHKTADVPIAYTTHLS